MDEEPTIGEPTELALLTVIQLFGHTKNELEGQYKRIIEFPFDSNRKLMSTIHRFNSGSTITYRMFVKGAPDVVQNLCTKVFHSGSVNEFSNDIRSNITLKEKNFGSEALRVLAFAYKDISEEAINSILLQK